MLMKDSNSMLKESLINVSNKSQIMPLQLLDLLTTIGLSVTLGVPIGDKKGIFVLKDLKMVATLVKFKMKLLRFYDLNIKLFIRFVKYVFNKNS